MSDYLFDPNQLQQLQPLAQGLSQTVYALNDQFILRVPKSAEAIQNMQHGIIMDQWLRKQRNHWSFRIPQVIRTFEQPQPMVLMERIHGKTPGALSESVRAKSAEGLANLLVELHRLDPCELIEKGLEKPLYTRVDRDELGSKIVKLMEDAHQKGWLQSETIERIHHIVMRFHSCENLDARKVPLHGDLHPVNVLVDSDGSICAVIDWDNAHVAHPAVDLSIVYSWLPPQARSAFWAIYGEQDFVTKCWAQMIAIYIAVHVLWAAILLKDQERESLGRQMLGDALDG